MHKTLQSNDLNFIVEVITHIDATYMTIIVSLKEFGLKFGVYMIAPFQRNSASPL